MEFRRKPLNRSVRCSGDGLGSWCDAEAVAMNYAVADSADVQMLLFACDDHDDAQQCVMRHYAAGDHAAPFEACWCAAQVAA